MNGPTPETPPGGSLPVRANEQDHGQGVQDQHSDIFFAAIQTTRMPMIVTDPRRHDNPIVFANPAFLNMTGYSREEIVGTNCRFLQGPEMDPDTVAQLRHAVQHEREVSV